MTQPAHWNELTALDGEALLIRALALSDLTREQVAERFTEDLAIDVAPSGVDVTSWAFVEADAQAEAWMCSRETGVLAGAAFLSAGLSSFDDLRVGVLARDGDMVEPGQPVAKLSGNLRQLLTFERTALNLVTHLSGVASLTAAFVQATAGTHAKVCDTRKTLPGLRRWQKYAVRCGGGTPHRDGLGDAMLVKDNHLGGVPLGDLAATLDNAAVQARSTYPSLKFVEVEVDTLKQLEVVLTTSVDLVLLDNMSLDQLRDAVAIRDAVSPNIGLEASGGVNLDTVAGIAGTGVDRISVGALTHSAPSLDLGLDRR
ncbi:MAG: carboxylating nicotinate-nucleotide diphosphorylase [Planctomycetota bacterium]